MLLIAELPTTEDAVDIEGFKLCPIFHGDGVDEGGIGGRLVASL